MYLSLSIYIYIYIYICIHTYVLYEAVGTIFFVAPEVLRSELGWFKYGLYNMYVYMHIFIYRHIYLYMYMHIYIYIYMH